MNNVNYVELLKMIKNTIKDYNMKLNSKELRSIYKRCYNEYRNISSFIFYANLDREIIKYNLKKRDYLHKAS